MRLLAIDTALGGCQAAILDGERVLSVRSELMDKGHQERLAPMVAEALAEAGLSARALDRIGVTVGPGSFTGLRVGLALAKGLSVGAGAPCVGVGVLEALARAVPQGLVAGVVDARRDRVYLQAFMDGRPLGEPELVESAEVSSTLERLSPGATATLVGPGAALPPGEGPRIIVPAPDILHVARIAAAAPEPAGRPGPLYLREPDARTIAERAADRLS